MLIPTAQSPSPKLVFGWPEVGSGDHVPHPSDLKPASDDKIVTIDWPFGFVLARMLVSVPLKLLSRSQ